MKTEHARRRAGRRLLHDLWEHGFIDRRIVVADSGHELTPRYEQVYWLGGDRVGPGVE